MDTERLLLVSPELADVLSAIICRTRDTTGAVPLVRSYDRRECAWQEPAPLLFQRRICGEDRAFTDETVRTMLDQALIDTELTDGTSAPLRYTPHDFRRLFITDAVLNGLPPHIAQVICGHKHIDTTMGYKAVYPAETVEAHRAFIARRRASRPSEEYRTPTEHEWDAFLSAMPEPWFWITFSAGATEGHRNRDHEGLWVTSGDRSLTGTRTPGSPQRPPGTQPCAHPP